MKTVELQLSEQMAAKLQEAAQRMNLSIESLILNFLEEKLNLPDPDFQVISDYVLKKNAAMYERLA